MTDINQILNPWTPITDKFSLKVLGKALEESGEYSSALARCLIQGIDECEPITGKSNRLWLQEELADVLSTSSLVIAKFNLDTEFINKRTENKVHQLARWMEEGNE